eukprot:PhF_6_TR30557/c0_g1_i1/m.44870
MDSPALKKVLEEHVQIKEKYKLVEADRRHNHESTMSQVKNNKESIKQLRKENKELKTMISTISKGGSALNIHDKETERLRQEIDKARLLLDDAKAESERFDAEVQKMREACHDVQVDNEDILNEEHPMSKKMRMLENRLDKSLIKFNEAQAIRKTYEQIVQRLKEERVGFDNQLAAIERTLKAKNHDYQELLNMSHNANHAKEVAKAELQQFRAAYTSERKQKEEELTNRKLFVQSRIDQTHNLEKKEKKMQSQALQESREKEEQQHRLSLVHHQEEVLSSEDKERLAQYEGAFRSIKEATGVSDVQDVIQKFITQEETHKNLSELIQEAQVKIDHLNAEKLELRAKLEELKYSGSGQLGTRRIVDEFEAHLQETMARCERHRARYEHLAKILINVKAGVEHLVSNLKDFKPDVVPPQISDETLIEVLKVCEQKIRLLVDEAVPPEQGDEFLSLMTMPELPSTNRRIKTEEEDEAHLEGDQGKEEEEAGDENDVFNREQVKRISALAVERETKKNRKKKLKEGL